MKFIKNSFFLAMLAITPAPVLAEQSPLPASFSLGRYVPADWWMYMHFVHNPERAWIDKQWGEVFEALEKSGIGKDILTIIFNSMDDAQRAQTEGFIAKAKELSNGVRWNDLVAREVVVAERLGPPFPDYMVLMRGAEGAGESNAAGLAKIFEFLATLAPKIKVSASKQADTDVWTLQVDGEPFTLNLLRKGDVVGFVTSTSGLAAVTTLMAGGKDAKCILDSPRFLEALKQVKAPEDALMYFDYSSMVRGIHSIIEKSAFSEKKADGNSSKEDEVGRKIVNAVFGMFDVFDYQITSMETVKHQEFLYQCGRFQADKLESPIARMCLRRQPFEKFDQFIPVDARSFSVDAFIDIPMLYQTIIEFVEKNIPDGAEAISQWKGLLASTGFDPHRDVFSWWSGETISMELPAAAATPMGDADSVLMIRVRDDKVASEKIAAFLAWLSPIIQNHFQQTLMITPATGMEGFQEVTIPPMAMFLRPVIGVKNGWLFIASSSGAIGKCLDVASGKAPSVSKNERFMAEGIIPKGPVTGASFADTSKFSQELSAALGMASMFGGMGIAGMPAETPEDKKVKDVIQKLFGVVMKLSPVVAKLDFYSSESSVTTVEGPSFKTTKVVTYKKEAMEEGAKSTSTK